VEWWKEVGGGAGELLGSKTPVQMVLTIEKEWTVSEAEGQRSWPAKKYIHQGKF